MTSIASTKTTPPVLTISAAAELIKDTLEDNFAHIWLCGEISNLSTPTSGHWYFTLKDKYSQLRCAMFRTSNRRVAFTPENGQLVICHGRISLYSQRGDIQIIADSMEVEGRGGLQLAFEQLKKKLEQEGLFAPEHKLPLPAHPTSIGVITSATGAAIHDIMNVLSRRSAGIHIILRPVLVQGEQSAVDISAAIVDLNQHQQSQVIIVGRGGGSLEDLQAFNSEIVARAIAASTIPVISAVGHETDYTIADFVADLRAPTPSAAAELVVKNRQELEQHIDQLQLRINRSIHQTLERNTQALRNLNERLRSPEQLLKLKQQRLATSQVRLLAAFEHHYQSQREKLTTISTKLHALSPLNTIGRGFVAVSPAQNKDIMLKRAKQIKTDDLISLRFLDGQVEAQVKQINFNKKTKITE